jgi:hypothetical protein
MNQELFGAHIQRSMTLLETSSAEHHWPIQILMYGQSIVGNSGFTDMMRAYLSHRFPFADIQLENRAIGGFTGERLVRTAVHDLYPFYPDLLIFHVYGGQNTGDVERIIANVRRYTTADIILFNDHKRQDEEISDSSAKFFGYLASKYDCELVDVSAEWPRYLQEHALQPTQLLRDGIVHPNVDGYALLTQLIGRHLRFNPLYRDPWDVNVRSYEAKRPLTESVNDEINLTREGWSLGNEGILGAGRNAALRLEFEGNRVDIVTAHTKDVEAGGTASVLIDGKPPSEAVSTWAFTRPSEGPGTWFPAVRRISHSAPLLSEDWTLRITRINDDATDFDFEVVGSQTGQDGRGSSKRPFRSNSGRVLIAPEDWMFADIMKIFKQTNPPVVGFEVHWKSLPMFVDKFQAPATPDSAKVYKTTLAQGLTNGKHTLEIILNGDGLVPIESIQVYRPTLR